MDIKQAQALKQSGVAPSPDYPDLPNDFTAAELIAFDPNAELAYRMAKDQNPGITRAAIAQNWRSFKIGRLWSRADGKDPGFLQKLADIFKRR